MRIAVLYRKPEESGKEYPLDSQGRDDLKHIYRIKQALESMGHQLDLIDMNLDSFEQLRKGKFALAFNLCDDGFQNNSLLEAHIPAMLDILSLSYTGSNFLTLATCLDKARTKEILSFHKICTPHFQVFKSIEDKLKKELSFPLIVKPIHEDASIGVRPESVVGNLNALKERIKFTIDNYHQPVLVEKFISGREVYVGILGSADKLTVLPISEVVFEQHLPKTDKICSYEAKWVSESKEYKESPVVCPAKLDKNLKQKLISAATKAYSLLGCRDYGRIDFRIDKNNQPYVLEVNPNPDISEDAGLARMARANGLEYDRLIAEIVSLALERKEESSLILQK